MLPVEQFIQEHMLDVSFVSLGYLNLATIVHNNSKDIVIFDDRYLLDQNGMPLFSFNKPMRH